MELPQAECHVKKHIQNSKPYTHNKEDFTQSKIQISP